MGSSAASVPAKPAAAASSEPAQSTSTAAAAKTDGVPHAAPLSAIGSDHASSKSLQKILQDRVHLLDEHSRLTSALQEAVNPPISPEHQVEQLKSEIKQAHAMVTQADRNPATLLPSSFHKAPGKASPGFVSEMKDAIDATTHELREWRSKLETLKSGRAERESKQKERAAERDKVFKLVTSLNAQTIEYEQAVNEAQTVEDGRLAQERLVNHRWEVKAESLRLQVIEAQTALETKLAGLGELEAQLCHVHIRLAERALAQMRAHFSAESEKQESDLNRAAASEKDKARSSEDPLERFRARQTAELLELEAQVLKYEQALATNPSPSFEEQQSLADKADKDFAQIKELLDDGRVSRLDAIRLNNEFRRIAPERERLVRNELAVVEGKLRFFEDALTDVEIELFQDSLHDRLEHDLSHESVSPTRWAPAEKLLQDLEHSHRLLLVRRQKALEKLSERTSRTLQQIARRLTILDQEYGFIRTQIFWVRDQDPIALGTFWKGAQEFHYLLKAVLRLASEATKPNLWSPPTAEFMMAALAILALPVPLVKLRRALGGLIRRDLGEAN